MIAITLNAFLFMTLVYFFFKSGMRVFILLVMLNIVLVQSVQLFLEWTKIANPSATDDGHLVFYWVMSLYYLSAAHAFKRLRTRKTHAIGFVMSLGAMANFLMAMNGLTIQISPLSVIEIPYFAYYDLLHELIFVIIWIAQVCIAWMATQKPKGVLTNG